MTPKLGEQQGRKRTKLRHDAHEETAKIPAAREGLRGEEASPESNRILGISPAVLAQIEADEELAWLRCKCDVDAIRARKKAQAEPEAAEAAKFVSIADVKKYWRLHPKVQVKKVGDFPYHIRLEICFYLCAMRAQGELEPTWAVGADGTVRSIIRLWKEREAGHVPAQGLASTPNHLVVFPFYPDAFKPQAPWFTSREIDFMERSEKAPIWQRSRPTIDSTFPYINKAISASYWEYYYSTRVFVFNDARFCLWFVHQMSPTNLSKIRNVVFNLSSGFFISSRYRSHLDICEEARWIQVFSFLKARHCFQNCIIRFCEMHELINNSAYLDDDKFFMTQSRIRLVDFLSTLRGMKHVLVENYDCRFLGLKERLEIVKTMSMPAHASILSPPPPTMTGCDNEEFRKLPRLLDWEDKDLPAAKPPHAASLQTTRKSLGEEANTRLEGMFPAPMADIRLFRDEVERMLDWLLLFD